MERSHGLRTPSSLAADTCQEVPPAGAHCYLDSSAEGATVFTRTIEIAPTGQPRLPSSQASPLHAAQPGKVSTHKRNTSTAQKESLQAAKSHKHEECSQSADAMVFTIEDDRDRQRVLAHYRNQYPNAPVIILSSPKALDEHHLIRSVVCPEEGQVTESDGLLFSSERMTLVLDLTSMTPGQIASLNDFLEASPECAGRPLSPQVHRIVLIQPNMWMPGLGRPGSDCWRRLQEFFSWQSVASIIADNNKDSLEESLSGQCQHSERYSEKSSEVLSNRALLQAKVDLCSFSSASSDDSSGSAFGLDHLSLAKQTVHADFSEGDNWRILLFGALTLNDKGRIYFCPGKLAELSDHQSVVLHDAPWDKSDFVDTLATAFREGGYRANGQWVRLPDSVRLLRRETSTEELSALKQRLVSGTGTKPCQQSGTEPDFVCLNKSSLEAALSNTRFEGDFPRKVDTLSELLGHCQQLHITGELTAQQWLRLLRRVDRLGKKPEIVVENDVLPRCSSRCQCRTYTHESTALSEFDDTHKIYRLTARDQYESLWYHTHMVSENAFRFELQETELLKALKEGSPVVLLGMDSHPILAARLESLLANPPYLFVHGHKIELPEAQITVLCPKQQQKKCSSLSLLWQRALQQATKSAAPPPEQEQLIALLRALPPSTRKTYPGTLPWEALDFQDVLKQQIELEKQQDGASQTLPVHYRKALHTLLVKSYRGDDNVYGYLKTQIRRLYPDVPPEYRADRRALQQWLQDHPRVDRDLLQKHFWSLVRHCPTDELGQQLPNAYEPPIEENINVLARFLVGSVAEDRQAELAQQLNIDPLSSGSCSYFDDRVRSRLRDALLVAGDQRKGSVSISEQVATLETSITHIINQNPPVEAFPLIKSALTDVLPDTLLAGDFKDLPTALVTGQTGSHRRQQRRVKRLASRVSQHPLVFLQGVAGAGKSHMAQAIVGELRKTEDWETMPEPIVLSLGPETSVETLYGQEALNDRIDGDRYTTFAPGPLLQWAMNTNPPVLILDEANLVQEGVLAPLAGLTRNPPQLCFQGETFLLTDRHRVILTGNPDHYDGRHMDSVVKQRMLTLYYRPLPPDTLAELIIQPALSQSWSPELKAHTTQAMLSLYEHYGNLLPDGLTPRDLQDVLAHMKQMLRHAHEFKAESITHLQVSTLVWQAFADSLAGAIAPANQPRLTALEHWYQGHFPGHGLEEKALSEPRQRVFESFLQELRKTNSDIDLCTGPVVALVRHYWLFLDKLSVGRQQGGISQGRRGLLVEGPAGWGKDLILTRVLGLWHQQKQHLNQGQWHSQSTAAVVHINANPAQWDAQVGIIKTAMEQGQKLVISELNLLPSRYLEGLFNEVLTGDAQPGFALFATMNPSSFGGREPLSTSLKNRCTQVQLNPLEKDDLKGILQRRYPGHDNLDWLSQRYQVLSDQLAKRHSPIQLTMNDLFRGAVALLNSDQEHRQQRFQSCYGLALQSLQWNLETLEAMMDAAQSEAMDDGRNQRQQTLSLLINRQRETPVTVQLLPVGARPAFNPSKNTLFLPDNSDQAELLETAAYVLEATDQTGSEPVASGAFNGNITQPVHHNIRKFFAGEQFNTGYYRLQVIKLAMINGQLQQVKIPCDKGGVEPLSLPHWPYSGITLSDGQQLGSGQFSLSKENWQPLPGLSARDQLIHLQCRENLPLKLARGNETGQLLVKLAEKSSGGAHEVTLDFIIKPDQAGLKPLAPNEDIQVCEGLCDPAIRQCLDDRVFSLKAAIHDSCYELQAIRDKPGKCLQLLALAQWCKGFGDTRNVPGRGLNLLVNLIREKQGCCSQQSQVFQALSEYFGVPVRMVSNDSHQYVEISPDGGKHWRSVNLGSGGQFTTEIHKPDFPPGITIGAPSRRERVDEAVLSEEYILLELYEKCLQGSDTAEAWKQFQGFLATRYVKYGYTFYNLLEEGRFESFLNKGFELDQALPDIFLSWQRQVEEMRNDEYFDERYKKLKNNVLRFLLKTHDLWESGALSEPRYKTAVGRCLGLIKQGIPPAGAVLPLLEQLAQDASWGEQSEALLDDFYQQLTQPGEWMFSEKSLRLKPPEINDLQGKSKTLRTVLHQTSVGKEWSWISSGKPPSIERMAKKQATFPVSQENQKARPVFYSLPFTQTKAGGALGDIFNVFVNDPMVQNKIPGMKELAEQKSYEIRHAILSAFLTWLFRQDTQKTWRCLVNESTEGKFKEMKAPLPGCYPALSQTQFAPEFQAEFFQTSTANLGGPHTYTRNPALNPERVKKAFGEPSALVITPDLLCTAYQEYLESMDWSLLLKEGRNIQS